MVEKQSENQTDPIRVELGDWLYNAGIVGLLKILSRHEDDILSEIKIYDTHIEFDRSVLDGLTDSFFEVAFEMHGKFDSIKFWLCEVKEDVNNILKNKRIKFLGKKYRISDPNQKKLYKKIADEISKRWKGVAYTSLHKVKKSEVKNAEDLKKLIEKLINIQESNRDFFVQKEVQTFLRGFSSGGSFLSLNVTSDQKGVFKNDFETPILKNKNEKEKKYNCIFCNSRQAKKNTIFSTALAFYRGLNKDAKNFVWGFNPNLPLCEICELIYFCHWAGYTKSIKRDSYLFVNDDNNVRSLWRSNQLLSTILQKDKKDNILINYFYELLVEQEKIKSKYTLQNIAIIETDLGNEVMPKVLSLHVSRKQAGFIKKNHEKLKWIAAKHYKIKDDYTNILHNYLRLMFSGKLNYKMINRLVKFYLQSSDSKKDYVTVNYNPSNIQQLVVLTAKYFETVKQKNIDMEAKHIWHVYYLGNEMQKILEEKKAENKKNGIAYRLLNAVRANDKSTFLNVLLRLYIGYNKEVPTSLVNTLESEEKFQVIGHSYINGLLGERKDDKADQQQKTS